MKLLCLLLGHRWHYWSDYLVTHGRRCVHRQCWHCQKHQIDLRHPEEEKPWWSVFDPKQGKLVRG